MQVAALRDGAFWKMDSFSNLLAVCRRMLLYEEVREPFIVYPAPVTTVATTSRGPAFLRILPGRVQSSGFSAMLASCKCPIVL